MKKIFTMILLMITVVAYSHNGIISLESSFKITQSETKSNIVTPECWDALTQVAFYRWVDADDNPIGWILGTNTYGDKALGQAFANDEEFDFITGAYFWIVGVGPGSGNVVFSVNEFDGTTVGDVISSVSMPLEEVIPYFDADGMEPADFMNAMYVQFDPPVPVNKAPYALVVDHSEIAFTEHGDGLAMVSNHLSEPCTAGHTFIKNDEGAWVLTTEVHSALDFVAAFFAEATYDDGDNGDDETFTVTFNVDMTNAEGFDGTQPVYVAGTFPDADWVTPGDNPDFEMTLVAPAKADTPPFTLSDDFSSYGAFSTDLTPWTTLLINDDDTWGASDFDFPGEGTAFAFMAFDPTATTPPIDDNHAPVVGSQYIVAVQSTTVNDDKWLITPQVSFHTTSQVSFSAKSMTDAYGLERMRVLVSTGSMDPADFIMISADDFVEVPTDWTQYTFNLDAFDGEVGYVAIQYVSYDAFVFMIDDFNLTADVDDDNGGDNGDDEEWIYTLTVNNIPGGHFEYKYFYGAGWDNGEFDGLDNREVFIEADVTFNDVWAHLETSVIENELTETLSLFPNPAREMLYVNTEDMINTIRVFDLTGRMVFSQNVNDNTASINVSEFTQGVYVMQVMTNNGMMSKRFYVTK